VKAKHRGVIFLFILSSLSFGQQPRSSGISYDFDRHYGQVEVGGRYVGAEFHDSRPLPSRISFYYPVANSIDLSTDYWKRGVSQPMAIGVRIGNEERHWIGKEPWTYTVAPHHVSFRRRDKQIEYRVAYEFCLNDPAMVFTLSLKNISPKPVDVEVYTHLALTLRTCQTYARKDSAWTSVDGQGHAIVARYDDRETGHASVFVENAGVQPALWTSSASELSVTDSGTSRWVGSLMNLQKTAFSETKGIPVAAFEYQESIGAGDSVVIRQIIGSCRRDEATAITHRLASHWRDDVEAYDEFVRLKSEQESHFVTGDAWLDNSVLWAKGILSANAHYLDGKILPMPCPAEYNFFFTHDVLMTDLAAVNFDLGRVKKDLLYVASGAKEDVIPHAYYWRDDGFKSEYCTPDNWNHFWFILLTGSYLRHSFDDSTGRRLYPIVAKSLGEVLSQVNPDHLMHAFRPDWWDIGHIDGPRAYTTVLAIRAIREYAFISSYLGEKSDRIDQYAALADSMQHALVGLLWDDQMNYLVNFNESQKDEHYYMGSLLAAAYGLLSPDKASRLVETAEKKLMAPEVGIRTVIPADFQTKESIEFYKFQGDEGGQPFLYINGGVWPHCNAWYALALNEIGRVDEAVRFVRSTMTVDGILRSPMGQPAMYEYRYTDPSSKEYGRIDKPSFLWAGGFYLKALYALFGLEESEWNISFSTSRHSLPHPVHYTLWFGEEKNVTLNQRANNQCPVSIARRELPSLVLPLSARHDSIVDVRVGSSTGPYLSRINAILHDISYDERSNKLDLTISSYDDHETEAVVVARTAVRSVHLDGASLMKYRQVREDDDSFRIEIPFRGSWSNQHLEIFLEHK